MRCSWRNCASAEIKAALKRPIAAVHRRCFDHHRPLPLLPRHCHTTVHASTAAATTATAATSAATATPGKCEAVTVQDLRPAAHRFERLAKKDARALGWAQASGGQGERSGQAGQAW